MRLFKYFIIPSFIMVTACNSVGGYKKATNVAPLSVSFANASEWNGKKVPKSGVCSNYGGRNKSPAIVIKGIPAGVNSILMKYSDTDSMNYNNGGHGTVGYKISGARAVTIPSIFGERLNLPAPFFAEAKHRQTSRANQGVYLAPCSGGKANLYSVEIFAVRRIGKESTVLGEAVLKLGRY